MKFISCILFASVLVSQVVAVPGRLDVRAGKGGKNGKGGGKGNGKGNAGGNGGAAGKGKNGGDAGGDLQSSLTLDQSVIATGFANNGQDVPTAGQVASLTSKNNFINFCATVKNLPITNGKQIKTGSCNPAPMGIIPSTDNMPSAKLVNPKNLDNIKENTSFNIVVAVAGFEVGNFVNAEENYFAAPQQTNKQGQIQGHSHVVVEKMDAIDQTKPTNPNTFAFFKGLNDKASGGTLTATVDKGLAAGVYRLATINTAANHQPCLVPVAQHGSLDDAIYFTVGDAAAAAVVAKVGGKGAATAGAAGAGKDAAGKGAAAGTAAGAGKGANDNANAKGGATGGGAAKGGADAAQGGTAAAGKGANDNTNAKGGAGAGGAAKGGAAGQGDNKGGKGKVRRFARDSY